MRHWCKWVGLANWSSQFDYLSTPDSESRRMREKRLARVRRPLYICPRYKIKIGEKYKKFFLKSRRRKRNNQVKSKIFLDFLNIIVIFFAKSTKSILTILILEIKVLHFYLGFQALFPRLRSTFLCRSPVMLDKPCTVVGRLFWRERKSSIRYPCWPILPEMVIFGTVEYTGIRPHHWHRNRTLFRAL